MKSVFFSSLMILLFSCSNDSSQGFELSGKLENGSGKTAYLEFLSNTESNLIDSVEINDEGGFIMHSKLPEPGFYNFKISDRSFVTLILDSSQKATLTGNAVDLGNTYRIEGSEDSKLFWRINQVSKMSYNKRDSLQKSFQYVLNSNNLSQHEIDSLDMVIGSRYDSLVKIHNDFLVQMINTHSNSFASLAAIQQLNESEYGDLYEKIEKDLSAKYPNSIYVKLFLERSKKNSGQRSLDK